MKSENVSKLISNVDDCSNSKQSEKKAMYGVKLPKQNLKSFNKLKKNLMKYIMSYMSYLDIMVFGDTEKKIRLITREILENNDNYLTYKYYYNILKKCEKDECEEEGHYNLNLSDIFQTPYDNIILNKCSFCELGFIECELTRCRCQRISCSKCNKIKFCYNHKETKMCIKCGNKCKTCDNTLCNRCRDNVSSECTLCSEYYCYVCDPLYLDRDQDELECYNCNFPRNNFLGEREEKGANFVNGNDKLFLIHKDENSKMDEDV